MEHIERVIWLSSLSMKITPTLLHCLTGENYGWERSQICSVFCLQKQKEAPEAFGVKVLDGASSVY